MNDLKNNPIWIDRFLSDEQNSPSSKRILGTLCVMTLCFTLIYSIFSKSAQQPPEALINTLGFLAFGLLGLTSIDKYTDLKQKSIEKIANVTPNQ